MKIHIYSKEEFPLGATPIEWLYVNCCLSICKDLLEGKHISYQMTIEFKEIAREVSKLHDGYLPIQLKLNNLGDMIEGVDVVPISINSTVS
jgi:hypothetical protein